jgi:ribosomal protein L37AE/L43A
MPVKPTEQEADYFARLEVERRTQALAAQESRAAEEERQRLLAVARHHCPKCAAPLVTLHYRGVEIEPCSHCQGVWLDRGELEQVLTGEPAQGFFGSLKWLWESGAGKRPCQRKSR